MARILELEYLALTVENRTDPLRKRSSFSGIRARCRIAHLEVVGAFGVARPRDPIGPGKLPPGLVDGDDGSRLVEDSYVCGEAIQCPLEFLAAPGFFFPGRLLAP